MILFKDHALHLNFTFFFSNFDMELGMFLPVD